MEKITFKYELGCKVIDSISGITGVIEAAALKKNQSRQYSVQPRGVTDDVKPEGWFMDEDSLLLVDEILARPGSNEVTFEYLPGDRVKDKVTGIKGIISYAIYWINGCKIYSVQPKAKKGSTKKPDLISCDESDIKLLEPKEKKEKPEKITGGPSTKSSSFRA